MKAEDFLKYMEELGMTATQLGAALGVASNTVYTYKSGKCLIPRAIGLAMEALLERKRMHSSLYTDNE
jgi:hypothetical protein